MPVRVGDLIDAVERFAPAAWAEGWDNVGLQFGHPESPVRRALVCLDVTERVIEEAVSEEVDLIVAHHPVIFARPSTLREDRPEGRLIAALVRSGIAFHAAHTNVDVAPGGTNDALAERLGLTDTRPMIPSPGTAIRKLAVYTPPESMEAVIHAAATAGAGVIGNYTHCTFRWMGKGTFLPVEGAHPSIGEMGRLESVDEERIEMEVPEERVDPVIEAIRAVHPYEEMTYDVFETMKRRPSTAGMGRVGRLHEPMEFTAFVNHVRDQLHADSVRVTRGCDRIESVAVCGGSGGKLVETARAAGADAYVTSEVGHHQEILAAQIGLGIVAASHAHTEAPVIAVLARVLRDRAPNVCVIERGPDELSPSSACEI